MKDHAPKLVPTGVGPSKWLVLAALAALGGCGFGGLPPEGPENLCASDDACGVDRCDGDSGRCVSVRSEPMEIVIEVIPPTNTTNTPLPN